MRIFVTETESCDPDTGVCAEGIPKLCDDGNLCNGQEGCLALTGDCTPGVPVDCDDGVGCNGEESCDADTGNCLPEPPPTCPLAEDECNQNGGFGGPAPPGIGNGFYAQSLRLRDYDQWSENYEIIQDLEQHQDIESAPLSMVLSDLNREGSRSYVVLGTECFHAGFTFNYGDRVVDYWYPQGISGTASAYDDGTYLGVPVALVSWYHETKNDSSTSTDKGARVSVILTEDFDDIRYRHTLLVEPYRSADGTPNFRQIQSFHAGGIAWYGPYLYVADTSNGFRVFDMTKMMRVSTGKKNSIGYTSGDEYHAFNYKYVIPQVNRYKTCSESCCVRFSFVSVDRTSVPPALVSGAYTNQNLNGRLHRWELDPNSRKLVTEQGGRHAIKAPLSRRDAHAGGYVGLRVLFYFEQLSEADWPIFTRNPLSWSGWCGFYRGTWLSSLPRGPALLPILGQSLECYGNALSTACIYREAEFDALRLRQLSCSQGKRVPPGGPM